MNVLFQTKKDDKLRNVYLDIFKDGRSVCTFFFFFLYYSFQNTCPSNTISKDGDCEV